ncbi:adapter-related protein, partial [Cystoisospora suis]
YSPNPRWYLDTILCVLEIGDGSPPPPISSSSTQLRIKDGEGQAKTKREVDSSHESNRKRKSCVSSGGFSSSSPGGGVCTALCYSTAYSLMQLIGEGLTESEEEDQAFRVYAVDRMAQILQVKRHTIPDILM